MRRSAQGGGDIAAVDGGYGRRGLGGDRKLHEGLRHVGCLHLALQQVARHVILLAQAPRLRALGDRSEEHTSELQSLMRISYAVFCLKKKNHTNMQLEIQ